VRKSVVAVDSVEGLAEVVGEGPAAVMVCRPAWGSMVRYRRAVLTNFLIVQPVCASIQRLTARAAKTMVRWASMESRLRW
jgi:hypothetical protein